MEALIQLQIEIQFRFNDHKLPHFNSFTKYAEEISRLEIWRVNQKEIEIKLLSTTCNREQLTNQASSINTIPLLNSI